MNTQAQANPNMREVLKAVYLDWINNYLSIQAYAEHNGLTVEEAEKLIMLARCVYSHPHPDE